MQTNNQQSALKNLNTALTPLSTNLTTSIYASNTLPISSSSSSKVLFSTPVTNNAPNSLQFNSITSSNLNFSISGWVNDANGAIDIARIDFRIKRSDGTFIDIADPSSITPASWDNLWGSFTQNISLVSLGLPTGTHSIWAVAYDKAGAASNVVEMWFSFTAPVINNAPNSLQFSSIANTNLSSNNTLSVSGWVNDANGATDIARIDFRIRTSSGTFIDVADLNSVTPASWDNRWGSFTQNISLASLGLATGTHNIWAIAYDRTGAASNVVETSFNFTAPVINSAPTWLQFNPITNTNLRPTDTLSVSGWVNDANGATDIARIDFRIKRSDGTFIDVADLNNVTSATWDSRWGSFTQNISLASFGLATGTYNIWAVAYDKAGAASNVVETSFNFTAPVINSAPTQLQFNPLTNTNLKSTDTLSVSGRVNDANGAVDIARIDFRIKRSDGTFIDIADLNSVTASTSDTRWGSFTYNASLASLNLATGTHSIWAVAYDKAGTLSNTIELQFQIVQPNVAPTSLQFNLNSSSLRSTDTLTINSGQVYDANGARDIQRVDFRIRTANGTLNLDASDATTFTISTSDNRWASFNYSLSLSQFNLASGDYNLWAVAYDTAGAMSSTVERRFTIASGSNISFTSFKVEDASSDNTLNTVFQGGAIHFGYNILNATGLSSVRLEAVRNGSAVSLGSWSGAAVSNALINLASFTSLVGGEYQFRAVARATSGQEFFSTAQQIRILSWSQATNTTYGTFAADTLNYSGTVGTGNIFVGRGGTDTLNLGVTRSSIININGSSIANFNPTSSTANQAIFRGTAFDYLTLVDGREIYFQGIENLRFSDGSNLELQVRTNDTLYAQQWNLRVSDVDSAWRFTQGSSDVMLVSLDSGIWTAPGASGSVYDISTNRVIANAIADDNYGDFGHGHCTVSVMASTANNGSGVAGVNWNSQVQVHDVYGYNSRLTLQQAIRDSISYARARNMRVVFQGGVQGEFWLNDGGTKAQLEQIIRDNADIAIFAVAAGNGYRDIDDTSIHQQDLRHNSNTTMAIFSGGVARLQTTHNNVIAVGALTRTNLITVNGLSNATSVDRASYSNYGQSLTLMAATDSPAIDKFGTPRTFDGTSCANPNMAGIASLVWSVNSNLTAVQIRQILIDTAMDLGNTGRDNNFGHGLVNADSAVRRAYALKRNSQLAGLYSERSEFS
jgi:serine protease